MPDAYTELVMQQQNTIQVVVSLCAPAREIMRILGDADGDLAIVRAILDTGKAGIEIVKAPVLVDAAPPSSQEPAKLGSKVNVTLPDGTPVQVGSRGQLPPPLRSLLKEGYEFNRQTGELTPPKEQQAGVEPEDGSEDSGQDQSATEGDSSAASLS